MIYTHTTDLTYWNTVIDVIFLHIPYINICVHIGSVEKIINRIFGIVNVIRLAQSIKQELF